MFGFLTPLETRAELTLTSHSARNKLNATHDTNRKKRIKEEDEEQSDPIPDSQILASLSSRLGVVCGSDQLGSEFYFPTRRSAVDLCAGYRGLAISGKSGLLQRSLKRNVRYFLWLFGSPISFTLWLALVTAEATNVSAICVGANPLVIVIVELKKKRFSFHIFCA